MNLLKHKNQYAISWKDVGLSAMTLFSGAPYARRHLDLAKTEAKWAHRCIAIIEFIPVVGLIAALFDSILGNSKTITPEIPKLPKVLPRKPILKKITPDNPRLNKSLNIKFRDRLDSCVVFKKTDSPYLIRQK